MGNYLNAMLREAATRSNTNVEEHAPVCFCFLFFVFFFEGGGCFCFVFFVVRI